MTSVPSAKVELRSTCPFPHATLVWTDARGVAQLTVVCKISYELRSVEAVLASDSEALTSRELPTPSGVIPADVIALRPQAELVVLQAPGAPRLTSVSVGGALRAGDALSGVLPSAVIDPGALIELSRADAVLRTRLPGVRPELLIMGERTERVRLAADTLVVDPAQARATLTFRVAVDYSDRSKRFLLTGDRGPVDSDQTSPMLGAPAPAPLPFAGAPSSAPSAPARAEAPTGESRGPSARGVPFGAAAPLPPVAPARPGVTRALPAVASHEPRPASVLLPQAAPASHVAPPPAAPIPQVPPAAPLPHVAPAQQAAPPPVASAQQASFQARPLERPAAVVAVSTAGLGVRPASAVEASNEAADPQPVRAASRAGQRRRAESAAAGEQLEELFVEPDAASLVARLVTSQPRRGYVRKSENDAERAAEGEGAASPLGVMAQLAKADLTEFDALSEAGVRGRVVALRGELKLELKPREELAGLLHHAQTARKDALLERALTEAKAALENPWQPDSALAVQVERPSAALLEQRNPGPELVRRFCLEQSRLREVQALGEAQLVARFVLAEGPWRKAIPCYLPACQRARLPLFSSFVVRALAQVHAAVDQAESQATALRIVALARVLG